MYFVYMHISPIGKRYIGITQSNPPKYRWGRGGKGYKGHTHFWFAIQYYGWDNFEHIIIAENLTHDEACQMEKDLIAKYETTNPKYGYNLSSGGDGAQGVVRSDEWRKRASEWMMGNKSKTGQKLSESEKQKLSERMRGNTLGAHRNITDEYKERALMSQPNRSAVIQYTLDGEFVAEYRSLNEAFRQTGIYNIAGASLHGWTAGGYKWVRKSDINISTEKATEKDYKNKLNKMLRDRVN